MSFYDKIKKLEKIDLHRHVDGDIKPEIIFEIAENEGFLGTKHFPYNTLNQVREASLVKPGDDLNTIFSKFGPAVRVMQTKEGIKRVFYEEVKNCYEDNIVHAELRFATLYHGAKKISKECFHWRGDLTVDEIMNAAISGMKKGEKDYGIKTGIIVSINREVDPWVSETLVKKILPYEGKGVVGIDLACNEADFRPILHYDAYFQTFDTGLKRTVHAGEAGDRRKENIIESILSLRADRVGHGIPVPYFGMVEDVVKMKNVGIESCPLSNLKVHWVTGIMDVGQLRLDKLLDENIKVSLNSDDPGLFGYTLTDTYFEVAKSYNFKMKHLKKFIENAKEISFL